MRTISDPSTTGTAPRESDSTDAWRQAPYTDLDRRAEEHARRANAGVSRAALNAVLNTACPAHELPRAVPCWDIDAELGSLRLGLCGARIRAAGFTGTVTSRARTTSIRNRHP